MEDLDELWEETSSPAKEEVETDTYLNERGETVTVELQPIPVPSFVPKGMSVANVQKLELFTGDITTRRSKNGEGLEGEMFDDTLIRPNLMQHRARETEASLQHNREGMQEEAANEMMMPRDDMYEGYNPIRVGPKPLVPTNRTYQEWTVTGEASGGFLVNAPVAPTVPVRKAGQMQADRAGKGRGKDAVLRKASHHSDVLLSTRPAYASPHTPHAAPQDGTSSRADARLSAFDALHSHSRNPYAAPTVAVQAKRSAIALSSADATRLPLHEQQNTRHGVAHASKGALVHSGQDSQHVGQRSNVQASMGRFVSKVAHFVLGTQDSRTNGESQPQTYGVHLAASRGEHAPSLHTGPVANARPGEYSRSDPLHARPSRSEHAPSLHTGPVANARPGEYSRSDPLHARPSRHHRMGRETAHDSTPGATGMRGIVVDRSGTRHERVSRPWAEGVLLEPHDNPRLLHSRRAVDPSYRAEGSDAFEGAVTDHHTSTPRWTKAAVPTHTIVDDQTVHLSGGWKTGHVDAFTRAAPTARRDASSEVEARPPMTGGTDVQRAVEPDTFTRHHTLAEVERPFVPGTVVYDTHRPVPSELPPSRPPLGQ